MILFAFFRPRPLVGCQLGFRMLYLCSAFREMHYKQDQDNRLSAQSLIVSLGYAAFTKAVRRLKECLIFNV